MTDLTATLAELKALLERSTPTPWRVFEGRSAGRYIDGGSNGIDDVVGIEFNLGRNGLCEHWVELSAADAALIVALVNAAPALIAAAERGPCKWPEGCLCCPEDSDV